MASNSILASMAVALTANVSDFQRGMAAAKKELAGFKKAGEQMKDFGENLSKYISAPLAGIAAVSLKTAGDLQALKKGLESVTGSAEAAEDRFKVLESTTKGLDLSTVAQADVSLQASGLAADKSLRSIKEFGNALKTVGRSGAADLKGALYGVQQLAATDFPMAEDLNIIKEAVPQVGKLLKEAFGTSRSEELAKLGVSSEKVLDTILTGLEKLPRVSGGLNNAWEGLTANIKKMGAAFGDSISKNLKIEESLTTLSEKAGMLANAFSNLSPTTQKFIVIGGALAASIGPILFGVGALAAAIPTLAAGFAVLTGPVGLVVAGFAALAVAAVKTFSEVKNTSKSFEEQKKHVSDLHKNFVPLIDRYEELKSKSELSKKEQTELNSIIAQIAKTAPDAITQFDKYGKALDISTTKAREFVKTQQAIAAIKNKEVIQAQVEEFKKLDKELDKLQAKLAKGIVIESRMTETARGVSSEKTVRDMTNAEKQELGFQIKAIQDKQNALRAYVRELNGLPPLLTTVGNAAEEAGQKLPGLTKEQQEEWDKIQAALQQANKEYQIHGDALVFAKDKASILERGWKSLLENGLSPQSAQVLKVAGDWKVLTQSLKDFENRAKELEQLDFREIEPPQLREGLALKVKLLPIDQATFEPVFGEAEKALFAFGERLSAMFSDLVTESIVALGNGIVNAINGGGIEQALNGFMSVILDFCGQFGRALVAFGIAKINFENLLKSIGGGPAAIAAGVALIAIAGVGKQLLAKGPAFSGPSGGQSASPNYSSGFNGNDYGNNQVEFMIRGTDLVGVMDRTGYRNRRFGG